MTDNAAVVRRVYEMFLAGDIPTMISELTAPSVVFHIPGKSVGGDKVGQAGLAQFFQTLGERAASMDIDIHDITTSEEHVVSILNHHHARGDRRLDMPATHIWHIHDGKVMEMWELVRDTAVWDDFWAA